MRNYIIPNINSVNPTQSLSLRKAKLATSICMGAALMFVGACNNAKTNETIKAPASHDATDNMSGSHANMETKNAADGPLCTAMGPQTPRDIALKTGVNPVKFPQAPNYDALNLCNIHTHTNAEHKGPGFSVFKGDDYHGGYGCNGASELTEDELRPWQGEVYFKEAAPGDTIEVHWVHSSCDIAPGKGLGACLTDSCKDPILRVESQVFLLVNDSQNGLNFTDMTLAPKSGAHYQAKHIPENTGAPVVFLGSTTGPKYNQSVCSPAKVTWSVRPQCAKLDVGSLHQWAKAGNVFKESKSHGVRQLVTAPQLLAPIK